MRNIVAFISRRSVLRPIGIGVLTVVLGLMASTYLAAQDKPAPAKTDKPDAGQQDKPATGQADDASMLALKNPGFEDGDKAPAGWEEGAAIDGVQYVWDKNVGQKSRASLCIKKTAERYFPIAEWRQTVANTGQTSKLKLTAFVKAEKAYKGLLDVTFIGKDGSATHQWAAYIGVKAKGDPPANHDWREYSGVVAIPKDTAKVCISLQMYGPGTLWFDNISARYVPDATPVSLYDEKGNFK